MKNCLCILLVSLCLVGSAAAQTQKPWSEWDKKDVDRMLNNSPWGQTQTETDTSQMMYSPTSDPNAPGNRTTTNDADRLASGAKNAAISLSFRIRLFSAKPIREAFARTILLANPNIKPNQLDGFINEDYSDWIVVAVAYESTDRRMLAPIETKFVTATKETLKNVAYLEGPDGKRTFVAEYAPPTKDGTGAKFFFPRITAERMPLFRPDQTFRFFADLGGGAKVNWKFKLSEMTYDGKLEY